MGGPVRRRAITGTKSRVVLMAVVSLLAWAAIAYRLFDLQVVRAAELEAKAMDQRLVEREELPRRGTILDRSGRELAVSVEGVSIYADPTKISDTRMASQLLGAVLGLDAVVLEERLSRDTTFVYVARQLEKHEAEEVLSLGLDGVFGLPEPVRVYPAGVMAAQVIGFVRADNGEGIEGLEYEYNSLLTGVSGRSAYEQDTRGMMIPQGKLEIVPPQDGSDIRTALDLSIQFVAESACADIIHTGAARCTILVLQPETGEILALAISPGFDPGNRSDVADESVYQNAAVRSVYEPGSTQKLVTVAAALEEEVVVPTSLFEVPDRIEVANRTFKDFSPHETQWMTVSEIVTKSSNVGTIMVQQQLGDDAHRRYLNAFGYGQALGVDFSGEATGSLYVDPTCGSCTASAAIGYSLSVTPLQMASFFATIANDGVWVQPHFVIDVLDHLGVVVPVEVHERIVVSAETAAIMRRLLWNVVENGTGRAAAVPGYSVGGKTGTSRKFIDGAYSETKFIASFIGMAPVDDPKLVVAVIIDSPRNGYTGGEAAAPAFAVVMEKALHRLGVEPDAS